MKSEPAYDAVFQALVKIRKDLHEKINSLDEQIRRGQLECIEAAFQQQKDTLTECLDAMDQELITLSMYVEEYQNLQGSLRNMSENILELGGTPPVMPETIAGDSLVGVLTRRLDYLRSQGKI